MARPSQDFSTIDVLYIPAKVCNATSIPHEHFFKRMSIDADVAAIVEKNAIDIYK